MKKLNPHKVDWDQIGRFLASAEKKLVSARKILAIDEEACLEQAYAAMLKASLGLMFSHGLRPRSQPGHHVTIIDFTRVHIEERHGGLIAVFDRLRRKRNLALYDDTGFVSHHDAEKAVETARVFIAVIRENIDRLKLGKEAKSKRTDAR